MFHRKTERGQALILITFAAIGLFAFAALAIDGSRAFSNKRHAQNTADTAVLTAALTQIRTGNWSDAVTAAEARATSNGYTDDGVNTWVMVNRCSDQDSNMYTGALLFESDGTTPKLVQCDGLPAGANRSEYIRVRIVSNIPTTFGRVIGRQAIMSAAEAIAHVEGSTGIAIGTSMSGAAMYATSQDTDHGKSCFNVSGGADIALHGSGIYVNCPKDEAVVVQSGSGSNNTTFQMDNQSNIPGCAKYNGGATNPGINCHIGSALPIDASTFAWVPTMPAIPDCSSAPARSGPAAGNVYKPGKYSSIVVTDNSTIEPGLYCISGDVTSAANLTQSGSGTVKFVMLASNKDFTTGGGTFTFSDLEVYTTDASLQVESVLNATRFRFYSAGAGDFIVKNGDSITSGNAYMYLNSGEYNPIAGAIINLHAPAQGDPYVGGVLVHLPWSNTNGLTINGGSNMNLVGTFLAPHSLITINGGAGFKLYSQLIGYEFKVNGGGQVDITYIASQNLKPPAAPPASIQFTK